jgi:hypothetical protein
MPANLPPQYLELEQSYRKAKSAEEKLRLLREMLACLPKHKGTEKIQAMLKTKISKFQQQEEKRKKKGGRSAFYNIEKKGAGQIVIVGPPNSGKSTLLSLLTNANPLIKEYPFTTRMPQIGMMRFEDIWIQLIDTPPVSSEYMEPWLGSIIRYADLALLLVDLSETQVLEQIENTKRLLKEVKVSLQGFIERDSESKIAKIPTILVGTKLDLPKAKETFELIYQLYKDKFPLLTTSITSLKQDDKFKKRLYWELKIIRVYSKIPGKPPDLEEPYVLKKGSTVSDMALKVHKDFAKKLKFARIWSQNKYKGQKVPKDYILNDKDILELHI